VSQSGASGTDTATVTYDAVASKSATFAYDYLGKFKTISALPAAVKNLCAAGQPGPRGVKKG
jgi:hypothetical protein